MIYLEGEFFLYDRIKNGWCLVGLGWDVLVEGFCRFYLIDFVFLGIKLCGLFRGGM